jgi:hypothetical protein
VSEKSSSKIDIHGLASENTLIGSGNTISGSKKVNNRSYNLFISHSWEYSEHYNLILHLLEAKRDFRFLNHSSPQHDPTFDPRTPIGKNQLSQILSAQIRAVDCILLIVSQNITQSEWILKEIDLAEERNIPIIAVLPIGQEFIPHIVQKISKVMVGWDSNTIIAAIQNYAN